MIAMDATQLQHALKKTPYTIKTRPAERFNRYRFTLYKEEQDVGTGTHFLGGNHIKPWIELQPSTVFQPEQDQPLFDALTSVLEPGSHIMVHYLQDTETAEAITASVPPPATPIGYLLWNAGVRWFKDWYFTEGWMEGDQKLQGNLPIDAETKQERETEWKQVLQDFVDGDETFSNCKERAEKALEAF